jgi:hypothetical protein
LFLTALYWIATWSTLKMEATDIFETLVHIFQSTRYYLPEDDWRLFTGFSFMIIEQGFTTPWIGILAAINFRLEIAVSNKHSALHLFIVKSGYIWCVTRWAGLCCTLLDTPTDIKKSRVWTCLRPDRAFVWLSSNSLCLAVLRSARLINKSPLS